MLSVAIRYYNILRNQRRPGRFLLAQALRRAGVSSALTMDRGAYRLRFHDAPIPLALWVDSDQTWEDEALVFKLLASGETFVDVGANVGALTCAAAAAVGPRGKGVSFEPNPRVFAFLEDNLRLNSATNVATHCSALADAPGSVFFSDLKHDNLNHIAVDGSGTRVNAETLDRTIPGDYEVSLLKIDVEGFELAVLKGGESTLKRTQAVLFESWDEHASSTGTPVSAPIELLRRQGFTVLKSACADWSRVSVVSPDHSSPRVENLLAIRDVGRTVKRLGALLVERRESHGG